MADSTTLLILCTVASTLTFSTIIAFGVIINIPNNGLFNKTIHDISEDYMTAITPADYAFGIWGVIYLFQFAWLAYAYSTMCRTNGKGLVIANPVVMPKKFHAAFCVSCLATAFWYFAFTAEEFLLTALDLLIVTLLGFAALFINMFATTNNEKVLANSMPADLICIRVLVQNGLCLFFSWSIFATLISISMAMTYDPNSPYTLSNDDAGSLCLYILGFIIVLASGLENTVLFSYTKYVYSWYAVLFWALSGIIVRYPDTTRKNTIITIVMLCISVVGLAAKITVFALTPKVKKSKKYKLLDENEIA